MTPDEKKPQPHPQQVFDKDLPLGYNDESLAHHLKSHKEWFGGWQGSGCLRNQNGNNHLENQWLNFLKIYNLKGDPEKDFLAFLQWNNETLWKDYIRWQKTGGNAGSLSDYFIQHNVKIQDVFERIVSSRTSTSHSQHCDHECVCKEYGKNMSISYDPCCVTCEHDTRSNTSTSHAPPESIHLPEEMPFTLEEIQQKKFVITQSQFAKLFDAWMFSDKDARELHKIQNVVLSRIISVGGIYGCYCARCHKDQTAGYYLCEKCFHEIEQYDAAIIAAAIEEDRRNRADLEIHWRDLFIGDLVGSLRWNAEHGNPELFKAVNLLKSHYHSFTIAQHNAVILAKATPKIRADVLDKFAEDIMERTGINHPTHFNPNCDYIPSLGVDELAEIINSLRSAAPEGGKKEEAQQEERK